MSIGPIELKSKVISGKGDGPHLLITGGVHGDEFEPMVAIRRLMSATEFSELRGQLTLVPVVNEAALARGNRVAEDSLDLARACPGKPNGSITERTAHALSELIRAADYYIDLHTGGATLSVWPMTGYLLHPNSGILDQQRAMARAFNLPVIWGTDPQLHGRSLSVARDAGVPAIYAEHRGGGPCCSAGVTTLIDGCLNVMAWLGMIDRTAVSSNVRFVVEDPGPGSGHMQQCYPAPANGFFEAAVELGQPVIADQCLGHVVNSLGNERIEVRAAETGRVLVLRTFSAVRQGDSLAVIIRDGAVET